ncbi:universal stress protein [Egbenema bharatensis]|uniref:universal stress protein n=1 Tax=Egbenema bharatensis TaxID=3463334 RepID=UPI003A895B58
MTSFHGILAALGRDNFADAIFDRSLTLAQQYHSRLILTHCTRLKIAEHMGTFIDAGFGLVSPGKLQQLDEEHRDQVDADYQWLCDYAAIAHALGVPAKAVHQVGDVGVQICRLANHSHADLIVMGRSLKPGLKRRFFGSTPDYVMRHASCPVLVVQNEFHTQPLPPGAVKPSTEGAHQSPLHLVDWKPTHLPTTIRSHTWN